MCEYRDRATVGALVGTFSITLTVGPVLFVSPSVFMFSAIIGISVYLCILMCAYIYIERERVRETYGENIFI